MTAHQNSQTNLRPTNIRLTAPRAQNALGHVRRISVTALLATGLWSVAISSDLRAQTTPKAAAPAPAPQEPTNKAATQAYEPAPPAAAGQLRIVPAPSSLGGPGRGPSYADVYRSIPFSRAEYAAHPTYRSEAALGLLLNQMPYPSSSPPVPQYGYVTPYQFDNTFGTPTFNYSFFSWPFDDEGGFGGGFGSGVGPFRERRQMRQRGMNERERGRGRGGRGRR